MENINALSDDVRLELAELDAELETALTDDVRIQLAELDSELEAALCQRNMALDRIDELERRNTERTTKLLIELNRAQSAADHWRGLAQGQSQV